MPVGYHINPDEGLITVSASGRMPVSEVTRAAAQLLEEPGFDSALPHLIDLRGLRPRSDDGMDTLLDFVESRYRNQVSASVAVVIDRLLERMHCADLFLLTCALPDGELFADYDQALKWLMRRAFAGAAHQPSIHTAPTTTATTLQNT